MVRPRTGSVYCHGAQKRWYGAISIGGGKRRTVIGKTEQEARDKLAALGVYPPPRAPGRDYRANAVSIARSVLGRSSALGWDSEMTARVIGASMTVNRIRRQVVGPCHYCGDELADTIDHVLAYASGGQDEPTNVVSACRACNAKKGRRPAKVLSF